jgi:hypothetical protein
MVLMREPSESKAYSGHASNEDAVIEGAGDADDDDDDDDNDDDEYRR